MELKKIFGKAKIYWHALGFGEEDPTKLEHFGITTVEAMAAGAVPVVIKKGGQLEIIKEGKSGYFWESVDGMRQKTLQLVEDSDLWSKISKRAIERSEVYSKENFKEKILSLVESLS